MVDSVLIPDGLNLLMCFFNIQKKLISNQIDGIYEFWHLFAYKADR